MVVPIFSKKYHLLVRADLLIKASRTVRSFEMKNCFAGLCALIIGSTIAAPGYAQQRAAAPAAPKKPAAPAPRRDITGVWLGPVDPRKEPPPPMTPWGQKFFDEARPLQGPRALTIA